MQQPQLIARDIYKSFRMGARRIEVLRGISMDIAHNETVFLSGASGAGKTTLLYTLAGLERPESGTVKFEGRELDSKTGDATMDLLLNLARDRSKTLLVVTHDTRLATRGDRQLHIVDGVLQ